MGLVFTPLQVLAFVTLAPSMRTEGASLFSLLRNLGAAIGVSIFSSLLAHNSQAMHEMIGASVTPFNRSLQTVGPPGGNVHQWLDPATRHGAAILDRMVNQQAQIVAYADDYVMLILTTLPALLLLLPMRLPRKAIETPSE
jgi:DHA2 family multidrug resistance protein